MERKFNRYLIIAAVAVIVVAAVAAAGIGNKADREEEVMQVVEQFCRAVGCGEFEKAAGLCTGDAMTDYMERYREGLESMAERDSVSTAIATRYMSDLHVKMTEMIMEKKTRTVFFTMTDSFGNSKRKVAVLREDRKGWKIEQLKAVN